MKVAILGDTHFGARNDNVVFHNLFRKFYTECLFPYLIKHDIKNIIQLGDIFDRRKYVNFNSLHLARDYFFDPLKQLGIKMHVLVGNHDSFHKNSIEVNSPRLLLGEYSNIVIHDSPETLELDGLSLDLIPWICMDNEDEIKKFIIDSSSDICMGHFELAGFEMDKGNVCQEGWADHTLLKKYDLVISGHFHKKSKNGNILYAGTPYEMTWSDFGEKKGFHVLDTKSRKLSFHENPHNIFVKLNYNDSSLSLEDIDEMDLTNLSEKIIKLVIEKRTKSTIFDKLMEEINSVNPVDITVVEDFSIEQEIEKAGDDIDQADDTIAIIDRVVDVLDVDLNKSKLKVVLRDVHNEALNLIVQ